MAREEIRVVVVAPGVRPEVRMIENTLEAMQEIVGGGVEVLGPHLAVGPGRIICNEDGFLRDLSPNRLWKGATVLGTFFVTTFDVEGWIPPAAVSVGIENVSLTEAEAAEICRLLG